MVKIKPRRQYLSAFSLVEISVVIVIIGILIAGISSGINLYREARISSLNSFTRNSIIARIPNLGFWSDTISTKSFTTNLKNNDIIDRWNDLNPFATSPLFADSPDSGKRPKYITKGINDLPTIEFDGIDDCLRIPFNLNYDINPAVSVFIVFKNMSFLTSHNAIFGNDDGGGWGRFVLTRWIDGKSYSSNGSNMNIVEKINSLKTDFIMSYISVQNVANASMVRINKNHSSITQTHNFSLAGKGFDVFGIGTIEGACSSLVHPSNIQVSEVIAYSRNLNIKEIEAVEDYLAKKYAIKLVN